MSLDERSRHLRRLAVRTLAGGGRGHVGSTLSLIEIMRVLYDDVLRYRPHEPDWPGRDRMILSKGHGCIALYVMLADKGFFPPETLDSFCRRDSILGGHPEGVQLLSRGNNLAFRSAKVDFTHRVDRVQINNAVVTGDSIGGSGKGFIYTDSKQYDLVGTVIPMFGINNAFGKLFGPLGGGPAGGLFGITFQVKGPLDKPDFRINPMSALAPGAFRSLFEYRAKEQPRVE